MPPDPARLISTARRSHPITINNPTSVASTIQPLLISLSAHPAHLDVLRRPFSCTNSAKRASSSYRDSALRPEVGFASPPEARTGGDFAFFCSPLLPAPPTAPAAR